MEELINKLAKAIDKQLTPLNNIEELYDNLNSTEEELEDFLFHDTLEELIGMNHTVLSIDMNIKENIKELSDWVSFHKTKDNNYYMVNDF